MTHLQQNRFGPPTRVPFPGELLLQQATTHQGNGDSYFGDDRDARAPFAVGWNGTIKKNSCGQEVGIEEQKIKLSSNRKAEFVAVMGYSAVEEGSFPTSQARASAYVYLQLISPNKRVSEPPANRMEGMRIKNITPVAPRYK